MRKSLGTGMIIILILVGLFFTGCTGLRPTSTIRPPVQPTIPNSASISPVENSTEQDSSGTPFAKMFLIALDDDGKSGPVVGCSDSLVAVETRAKDARTALQSLLENHNQYYGQSGLYNALYQSTLKIERFESKGGETEVDLTGNILLGGMCDNPRVNEQLTATIRQSTTENLPIIIRINGTPLEDILSQK